MGRTFTASQAVLGEVPLLIGLVGPPGGGKTWSALRLAQGMRRVRPGPVVVIDTERGRARKYARDFDFLHVPFEPPFKPGDFLQAVRDQLPAKPAAIIVDSLSDEHEGEGGVIDWHDAEVERFKGNEHAAWGKPKADRKRMIGGFMQITTPLIFTFRAREKTVQQTNDRGRKEVVNIGWQPIAPLEIVHALDLVCLLPPRAEGVPSWRSDKAGENFVVKLPNYLQPFIRDGQPLSEDMGEAFARWALGDAAPAREERPVTQGRAPADPSTRVQSVCLALGRARDAEAVAKVWRLSGELRAELEAAGEFDLLDGMASAHEDAKLALTPMAQLEAAE